MGGRRGEGTVNVIPWQVKPFPLTDEEVKTWTYLPLTKHHFGLDQKWTARTFIYCYWNKCSTNLLYKYCVHKSNVKIGFPNTPRRPFKSTLWSCGVRPTWLRVSPCRVSQEKVMRYNRYFLSPSYISELTHFIEEVSSRGAMISLHKQWRQCIQFVNINITSCFCFF